MPPSQSPSSKRAASRKANIEALTGVLDAGMATPEEMRIGLVRLMPELELDEALPEIELPDEDPEAPGGPAAQIPSRRRAELPV